MKKVFQLFQNFIYRLRIQTKFTITHLFIATIPLILIMIVFYGKFYDMVVADTIRAQQDATAQTGPELSTLIQEITQNCKAIESPAVYKQLFSKDTPKKLKNFKTDADYLFLTETIQSALAKQTITSVKIYAELPDNHSLFLDASLSQFFEPLSEAKGTYWYGIFQGSHYQDLHCPGFYLSHNEIKQYGNTAYISKSSVFYDGKYIPVYTAVYYSDSIFISALKDNIASTDSVAYILDKRDSTVASTSSALSGTYHFDYRTVSDFFLSSNNFIEKKVLGETVYAGFYRISEPEWFLVVATPSKSLIQKSTIMILKSTLVFVFLIIAGTLFAMVLSHSITHRISSVIRQMKTVREGIPNAMPPSKYHDEIGDLIDTYNYMTKKIHQLMDEQAKSAEDLRIAEFNALQAQINPHFLYNTMDMINWLSQQGKTDEVTDAIRNLSRFYKLTLSKKGSINTIGSELEHVSIYVHLQNMRFYNNIDFVIDIPDDFKDIPIPKLTLQPIVENSIIHGIMEKENKRGRILITGWQESQQIVLLVSDDGIGMDETTLNTILSGQGQSKTGTNIAIYNTHQRMVFLYGSEFGLSYQSTPGVGTEVQIRLPVPINK